MGFFLGLSAELMAGLLRYHDMGSIFFVSLGASPLFTFLKSVILPRRGENQIALLAIGVTTLVPVSLISFYLASKSYSVTTMRRDIASSSISNTIPPVSSTYTRSRVSVSLLM